VTLDSELAARSKEKRENGQSPVNVIIAWSGKAVFFRRLDEWRRYLAAPLANLM
jgi:hypothetical protein